MDYWRAWPRRLAQKRSSKTPLAGLPPKVRVPLEINNARWLKTGVPTSAMSGFIPGRE